MAAVEGPPGTVALITLEQVQLIPQPSSSSFDPLNWPFPRKLLASFCWAVYVFFNSLANANIASVLKPLSAANGLPVSTLNAGTGYLFLLAGWSLVLWHPFALQYGKRLTYIVSLLGLVGTTVWAPYCRTSGQWYGRSILAGFFAAPVEALPELSIADTYFLHERGTYTGFYAFVLVGSNFFAPFICGFINVGQGWQWVFYYPAIFAGAAAIFLYVFMEETNFQRTSEPAPFGKNISREAASKTSGFRSQVDVSKAASTPRKWTLSHLNPVTTSKPFVMHKRAFLQLSFLLWPLPLYAGFIYGTALIWFNVLNATASEILSAPPYNFASSLVGTAYIAPLLGTLGAFPYAGIGADYLARHLASRNKGVFEPEMRLWLLLPVFLLVTPASLILWGLGAAHEVHWIGLLFAMAGLGFQNTVGASVAFNYLVDSYREMSADALTAVICVRNTMSFAVNYGITPWIDNLGLERAFGLAAGIAFACGLISVSGPLFGRRLRQASASKYWHLAEREGRT